MYVCLLEWSWLIAQNTDYESIVHHLIDSLSPFAEHLENIASLSFFSLFSSVPHPSFLLLLHTLHLALRSLLPWSRGLRQPERPLMCKQAAATDWKREHRTGTGLCSAVTMAKSRVKETRKDNRRGESGGKRREQKRKKRRDPAALPGKTLAPVPSRMMPPLPWGIIRLIIDTGNG